MSGRGRERIDIPEANGENLDLNSLLHLIYNSEEKLRLLREEQIESEEELFPAINCSFLLEILSVLRESIEEVIQQKVSPPPKEEIFAEIFFHRTSIKESLDLERVLINLARLFREQSPTEKKFQQFDREKSLISRLRNYLLQKVVERKTPGKKNTEREIDDWHLKKDKQSEKLFLLEKIIYTLDEKKLLPPDDAGIPLSDVFMTLADLIEEQAELFAQV